MKARTVLCIGAAALVVGCNRTSVEQASQAFNQAPAPVQETVRSRAPNAEVAAVNKETRNGITVYRIEFRDGQRHPPMEIAGDGTIVKYEAGTAAMGGMGSPRVEEKGSGSKGTEFSALPVNVQQAIAQNAPKAAVSDVRRLEENGRVIYEVTYAGQGTSPVLRVAVDGTVIKRPE